MNEKKSLAANWILESLLSASRSGKLKSNLPKIPTKSNFFLSLSFFMFPFLINYVARNIFQMTRD